MKLLTAEPSEKVLTPEERRFAEHYFNDEDIAGNGTRCFMAVHPNASYATASVEASELLKQPRIREYLSELREAAIQSVTHKLVPWQDLLPGAQGVIIDVAEGRLRSRIQLDAALAIVNRALGLPHANSSHEIIVNDRERIGEAVRAFTDRLNQQRLAIPERMDNSKRVGSSAAVAGRVVRPICEGGGTPVPRQISDPSFNPDERAD